MILTRLSKLILIEFVTLHPSGETAQERHKSTDAVAQFAQATSASWQTATGLTWLERIMNNRYDQFAGQCWFVTNWLAELRETTTFDQPTLIQWRRIVDGLAGAADARAVNLQRIDE